MLLDFLGARPAIAHVYAMSPPLALGQGSPGVQNMHLAERCQKPEVVGGLEAHPGLFITAVTTVKTGRAEAGTKRHRVPQALIPKSSSKFGSCPAKA